MAQESDTIGIIAGNRSLPLVFARQAKSMGIKRLVAVAFENETSADLAPLVDDIVWLKVGQLSKMISALKDRGVCRCVMLGQIAPKNLFDLRPDFRALALLMKLKEKNAHSIFGALADELKKEGIDLIEPVRWLQPLMPKAGFCLGPELTADQRDDVTLGLRMAKEISRLEIGQTVVVKEGTVLAVEGFEGTDNCLRRGGTLAGNKGGAVAVKVAKDKHDLRFDIPCIGAGTLETCREANIAVFAFESGKTLLMDRDVVETFAKKHQIGVTAC
jgi:DUF1009 family protein